MPFLGRAKTCLYPIVASVIGLVLLSSCASYYHKNFDFNKSFERGDLPQALEALQQDNKASESKSRFIHFVNQGLLLSLLGDYEGSNENFEKAYLFGEDTRINYFNEAASYLTNPNFKTYRGEDHEHLMLLYFKALNFLKMQKPEEALVECRRLNIRLNQLSDRYTSDRKLQRDAFIHNLMGIIYQSTRDYNNAFIAYRNALEVYENDYSQFFGLTAPDQLKIDLLNTAKWSGLHTEYDQYKEKFGLHNHEYQNPDAELLFFWHNGLAPVKQEWSLNFVLQHEDNNKVIFANDNLGMSFPFNVENEKDKSDLKNLEIFRVAFPRYVERSPYFQSAQINSNGKTYDLQLSEDINKIAFYSLQQRMLTEFGKGLLRAALKKATEHSLRKEDESLGAVIGLVNALTEKADTRNWQTLPYSIHYARVPLAAGPNKVTFSINSPDPKPVNYEFTYTAKKGQTLFHTFSSLEIAGTSFNRFY